jgi:RHS repeat-associated protein
MLLEGNYDSDQRPVHLWAFDLPLFTGKERDTESGNDYFGARYYASSMGRFMSPDPMLNSGRPDNPQSWNRYAYVKNNPLGRIDPTGLYDLPTLCHHEKGCSDAASKLKQGVSDLTAGVNAMKDGPEMTRLQAALKTLGTENDGNNVDVNFGKNAEGAAGHTDPNVDPSTGKVAGFTLTLDPSQTRGSDGYAINAAHESTHVNDLNDGSFTDFADEYRAYQTSAWSAAALWQYHGAQGTGTFTLNGSNGSSVIWNSSWGAIDDTALKNHII